MEAASYPFFAPPGVLADKGPKEWTKKEAQSYFDWFMGSIDHRVDGLLSFLGIDPEGMEARELLARAGQQVAQLLKQPPFTEPGEDGPDLTVQGAALAADIGILTAKLVYSATSDHTQWEILRRLGKREVSYNLPVLAGYAPGDWEYYEPVGTAIAEAYGVLANRRPSTAWVEAYDSCVSADRRNNL